MSYDITPYQHGEKIQPFLPDNSIYEYLGEDGIRKMMSDFYDLLRESKIKDLFPHDDDEEFELAKQRASDFIIQRFGGPDYFTQRRGNPMLVKRHEPFKITPEARLIWLDCYLQVIKKIDIPEQVKHDYWRFIDEFSTWMVNSVYQVPANLSFKPN